MQKILVVCAHPDDESLGLGGTLLLHSQKGDKIKVLVITDGETSRQNQLSSISTRQKQCKQACKTLGITNVDFLDYKDQSLDTTSVLSLSQSIEKEISLFNPSLIYTHFWNDLNQDHRRVFEATKIASRPVPKSSVKELICFETPSSTEWSYGEKFSPNYFVDVKKVFNKKLKAISYYEKELQKYPHPRSVEGITSRAQYWGSTVGVNYAEAFVKVFEIR